MKRAIDWRAVEFVVQGSRLDLTGDEKRMVVRRLSERILTRQDYCDDWWSPSTAAKLTARDVADRLRTSERTVARLLADMPPATKRICPQCGEQMWVLDDSGIVEAHPDRFYDQCPNPDEPVRNGLAAQRPDLYRWLELSA